MDPLIVACLAGVALLAGVTAVVVRNRRVRNGK